MPTGSQNGDFVIRQSREYIPYQPGKSKLVYITGVLSVDAPPADIKFRIGSFDDSRENGESEGNGYFFELDAGTLYVVERRNGSGSGSDTRVAQTSWNMDTFDGSGNSDNPSSIKLVAADFQKAMLFWIDLAWLAVGPVRMGFCFGGKVFVAHEFEHAAYSYQDDAVTHTGITQPYIPMAKLPVRWEIRKVAANANAGKLRAFCCSVQSEGGFEGFGYQRSITNCYGTPSAADVDINSIQIDGKNSMSLWRCNCKAHVRELLSG